MDHLQQSPVGDSGCSLPWKTLSPQKWDFQLSEAKSACYIVKLYQAYGAQLNPLKSVPDPMLCKLGQTFNNVGKLPM